MIFFLSSSVLGFLLISIPAVSQKDGGRSRKPEPAAEKQLRKALKNQRESASCTLQLTETVRREVAKSVRTSATYMISKFETPYLRMAYETVRKQRSNKGKDNAPLENVLPTNEKQHFIASIPRDGNQPTILKRSPSGEKDWKLMESSTVSELPRSVRRSGTPSGRIGMLDSIVFDGTEAIDGVKHIKITAKADQEKMEQFIRASAGDSFGADDTLEIMENRIVYLISPDDHVRRVTLRSKTRIILRSNRRTPLKMKMERRKAVRFNKYGNTEIAEKYKNILRNRSERKDDGKEDPSGK